MEAWCLRYCLQESKDVNLGVVVVLGFGYGREKNEKDEDRGEVFS